MVCEQEAGRRPINRPRSWQEATRRQEKIRKKNSWYKSGGYSTVIFCPYTPGSTLAKKWRLIEARGAETRGWRYKVVELGGRQMGSTVCRKTDFKFIGTVESTTNDFYKTSVLAHFT